MYASVGESIHPQPDLGSTPPVLGSSPASWVVAVGIVIARLAILPRAVCRCYAISEAQTAAAANSSFPP